MQRIKLARRHHYFFQHDFSVKVGDLNYAEHLAHDKLIAYLHHARVAILRQLDISERDLGDGQTGLILTDLCVCYQTEAFLFDRLRIHTALHLCSHSRFQFHYAVEKAKIDIALAECNCIAFNYHTRKIARIPERLVIHIRELEY